MSILRFERRPADEARAVWCFAVCVLAFGLHAVDARYRPAIAAAQSRAQTFYRRAVADERLVRDAPLLERAQRAAAADLRRVSRENSISSTTADLIEQLARTGRRDGVAMISLQPGSSAPSADRQMPVTPLTMVVRGRFRGLLQFVEDISRERTLLRVTGTQLGRAAFAQSESASAEPALDATVSAQLYRPHLPPEGEEPLASSR